MELSVILIVLYLMENYKDSPLRTVLTIFCIDMVQRANDARKGILSVNLTDLSLHESKVKLTANIMTCKMLGADFNEVSSEMAKIEGRLSQIISDTDKKHPLSEEDKHAIAEKAARLCTIHNLSSDKPGLDPLSKLLSLLIKGHSVSDRIKELDKNKWITITIDNVSSYMGNDLKLITPAEDDAYSTPQDAVLYAGEKCKIINNNQNTVTLEFPDTMGRHIIMLKYGFTVVLA